MDEFVRWVAARVPLGIIAVGGALVMLSLSPVVALLIITAGAMGILLGACLLVSVAFLVAAACEARTQYVEREARLGPLRGE